MTALSITPVKPMNPYSVEGAAFLVLLGVAAIDRISPPDFSVVLLYMAPLAAVAWFGSVVSRWRLAMLAVAFWSILDCADNPNRAWSMLFWVVTEKAVLFGGATYLVARLRNAVHAQRHLSELLSERLRVVEQLAAGVAHEVRNPLGTILSGVEYLARRERPENERLLVEDMHGAVVRAEVIVRDLNDFSAPLRLAIEPVEVGALIAQAVREATPKADAAGVTLVMRAVPPSIVAADATRAVQVLVNLIRNAVDVSPRGATIRIDTRRLYRHLAIEVDDEGPGIPEDKLAQVFEPFYTTKAPGSGTGLGLAVSRRIAQDHGGQLLLANLPERGLRASLTLPLGETA